MEVVWLVNRERSDLIVGLAVRSSLSGQSQSQVIYYMDIKSIKN